MAAETLMIFLQEFFVNFQRVIFEESFAAWKLDVVWRSWACGECCSINQRCAAHWGSWGKAFACSWWITSTFPALIIFFRLIERKRQRFVHVILLIEDWRRLRRRRREIFFHHSVAHHKIQLSRDVWWCALAGHAFIYSFNDVGTKQKFDLRDTLNLKIFEWNQDLKRH